MTEVKRQMLDGQRVKGCEKCYIQESHGMSSLRKWYVEKMAHGLDVTRLDDPTYGDGLWFDLSLGNGCNHRCRICNTWHSTAWLEDAERMRDMPWAGVGNAREMSSAGIIPNILSSMQESSGEFVLHLRGGEPLMLWESRSLLKSMIRLGLADKCKTLIVQTNGTAYDGGMLDLIRAFPSIDMEISIDATGRLYEYVRGSDQPWDECRRKWHRLVNLPNLHELFIANTIYAYTVFEQARLREWARSDLNHHVRFRNGLLMNPRFLHARMLPDDIRLAAMRSMPDDCSAKQAMALGLSDDEIRAWAAEGQGDGPMAIGQAPSDWLRSMFRRYTMRLDQLRGESLADVLPELASLMDDQNAALV